MLATVSTISPRRQVLSLKGHAEKSGPLWDGTCFEITIQVFASDVESVHGGESQFVGGVKHAQGHGRKLCAVTVNREDGMFAVCGKGKRGERCHQTVFHKCCKFRCLRALKC